MFAAGQRACAGETAALGVSLGQHMASAAFCGWLTAGAAMQISYQRALAAVFVEGCIFIVLAMTGQHASIPALSHLRHRCNLPLQPSPGC